MADTQPTKKRLTSEEREALRQKRTEARASATYREFLKDLRARGYETDAAAELAAGSVLSALEYRLTSDQSWNLESQLPLKLRELLTRSELHEELLPRAIHRAEFLRLVAENMASDENGALHAAVAVFETLACHVTGGEVLKLIHQLPPDLRELWPTWARAGEEYRATVLQALPSAARGPHDPAVELVENFLELPLRAQLAALRALTPWVLARVNEEEQRQFLHRLSREIAAYEQALSGPMPPTFSS